MKFKKYVKESVEHMHKRCKNCDTLLDELDNCPNCTKQIEEELSNIDKLKKAFPELNFDHASDDSIISEELSNIEKLKKAYPELNFDSTLEESSDRGLSNIEKLKRAYPELNLDDNSLNEGVGSNVIHVVKDMLIKLSKDDKYEWAKIVSDVVDIIPEDFVDELFDAIKEKLSTISLNKSEKKQILDTANVPEEEVNDDTLGKILDVVDYRDIIEDNPSLSKTFVSVVLGIVALIEPSAVGEVVATVVSLLPDEVVAKLLSMLQMFFNPAIAGVSVVKKIRDSKNESLRNINKTDIKTNLDDDLDDFDYDDDYDDLDDIEEDRLHAALYGGDRTYCDCGRKLVRNEWGGYCPYCDVDED